MRGDMRETVDDAVATVRKRWLFLTFLVLISAAVLVAVPAVLRLPQYPAHQVASLRERITMADLAPADRLALEKDLLQYETDNRVKIWSAIAQAAGGAALLIGLLFTWRNLRATQRKLDIDREGQLTNRFTQATTQLGAQLSDGRPNVEARLGGIYALSWIARDSPNDYWPIMEVLTAYVRHNAEWPGSQQEHRSAQGMGREPKPRTDVQAILTVLGRSRPPEAEGLRLDRKFDLRATDLRGAEFWDAHLEKADFWGANLEGAKLWGACLDNAKLVKARLHGANLRSVRLAGADLTDAELDGADLQGADLRDATGLTRKQVESALGGGREALLPADLPAGEQRVRDASERGGDGSGSLDSPLHRAGDRGSDMA